MLEYPMSPMHSNTITQECQKLSNDLALYKSYDIESVTLISSLTPPNNHRHDIICKKVVFICKFKIHLHHEIFSLRNANLFYVLLIRSVWQVDTFPCIQFKQILC